MHVSFSATHPGALIYSLGRKTFVSLLIECGAIQQWIQPILCSVYLLVFLLYLVLQSVSLSIPTYFS